MDVTYFKILSKYVHEETEEVVVNYF